MYVPTWVIAVVAVIVLLVAGRKVLSLLVVLFYFLLIPALLASMFFGMWFLRRGNTTMAALTGAPFLGLIVWGLIASVFQLKDQRGRLNTGALHVRLFLHTMHTNYQGPTATMDSRIGFASSIGLGERLLRFYSRVRHMPSWYNPKWVDPDAPTWSSNVISRESVARLEPDTLAGYGIKVPEGASFSNAVVVKFLVGRKRCVFCAHDDHVPDWAREVGDDSWLLKAFHCYVVESPNRLVLEHIITYDSTPSGDIHRYDSLEAFRPDEWLVGLLSLADAVEAESDAHFNATMSQNRADSAKKFV